MCLYIFTTYLFDLDFLIHPLICDWATPSNHQKACLTDKQEKQLRPRTAYKDNCTIEGDGGGGYIDKGSKWKATQTHT